MSDMMGVFEESIFQDEWKTDWADSKALQDGIEYAFASGGKRIRPLLCLRLTDILNGDRVAAERFARAIESLHNLTLVHDDIMDKDTTRRGKEAVWKKHGLENGILIGDALYALGYTYLSELSDHVDPKTFQQLLELYTDTSLELADGQAMDLRFRERDEISKDAYMRMAQKKTGSLFDAALTGSAVLAGVDNHIGEQMAEFAHAIGPAFQIRDDVIDLTGEKGRNRLGGDIAEGKRSLIAILALQRLEENKRNELLQILNKPREQTTQTDIDRAIALFRSVDAIEDANAQAEELIKEATGVLTAIDEYNIEELRKIADFLVERTF